MEVVYCKHIGFIAKTIVVYNGKEVETQGKSVKQLVDFWRKEFQFYEKDIYEFVLALDRYEYNAIQCKPFRDVPSIMELLKREGVYCVCKDKLN